MKRLIYLMAIITVILTGHPSTAQEYMNTTVTPHLDVALDDHENVVYASTFHLAWKHLQDDILKDDIWVKEDIPLVALLNHSQPVPVDEQDAVSLAGFVKDGIDKQIIGELKKKFNRSVDLSEFTNDPSNIICYSFFRKEIRFKTSFETFDQPFPFYSGGRQYDTEYFGIWNAGESEQHQRLRELVKVIDYKSMTDFIISISNPGEDEELVIAECKPGVTLGEMIEAVIARMHHAEATSLVNNDRLILPKISIDVHKKYLELYGIHLANKNFEDYFFTEAAQDICFKLNESGAFTDAEAKLIIEKGPGPRTLIVNGPFLIMIKEKQADKPYFAAWITTPELLVKPEL